MHICAYMQSSKPNCFLSFFWFLTSFLFLAPFKETSHSWKQEYWKGWVERILVATHYLQNLMFICPHPKCKTMLKTGKLFAIPSSLKNATAFSVNIPKIWIRSSRLWHKGWKWKLCQNCWNSMIQWLNDICKKSFLSDLCVWALPSQGWIEKISYSLFHSLICNFNKKNINFYKLNCG